MSPGTLAIYMAATFGLIAFISSIRWARGNESAGSTFRYTYHGMTVALGIACVFLMTAILMHDFRYEYVINYSSRELPLIYVISSFWGGQEGTFLMWAFMGALIGYPLFRKRSWEPSAVMACYTPTVLFMIGIMLKPSGNPFRLAATVPPDGNGLNPLLQDPWMAIHPPTVFIGYVAITVPAALAMVALLKKDQKSWLGTALRWSLVGFVSLGTGVILGGFWAYKVLGWGGYWGWDPVENASLIPWIVVTALLHGLLVQRSTGSLPRTNMVLALAGYLLVIYSTYLTRSGVLADFSVHSFPEEARGVLLLVGMGLIVAVSAFSIIRRGRIDGKGISFTIGWQFVLTLVAVLFIMSAALVLVGTSWPIISSVFGKPSVPEIPFYNKSNMPVYLVLLLLLGIAPFTGWTRGTWTISTSRVALSAGLAVAGTIAAAILAGTEPVLLVITLASCFALFSNIIRFLDVCRKRWLNAGASIAHIGFALMFIGFIASSAWDREVELDLPLGHPVEAMDRIFTFRGHVDGSEPNDLWRVGVMDPGGEEVTGLASMYQTGTAGRSSVMRKPAILRSLFHDLYLAPHGLETGRQTIDLVQGKPALFGNARMTFLGFEVSNSGTHGSDMQILARLSIETESEDPENIDLLMTASSSGTQSEPVEARSLGGTPLLFEAMSVEERMIRIVAGSSGASQILVLTASVKPLMNVLWAGTVLLLLGCAIAAIRRYVDKLARLEQA